MEHGFILTHQDDEHNQLEDAHLNAFCINIFQHFTDDLEKVVCVLLNRECFVKLACIGLNFVC